MLLVFTEVFNNIIDHSQSLVGGTVFAQHYPRKNKVILCISDFGIGIPTSIRKKYDIQDDAEAIRYATLQHITTESNPQNRGMGLDTLVNIIKNNGGNLLITSNMGKLVYTGAHDQPRLTRCKNYMGTLVTLVFRTDTLEFEEEEDFSW